MADDPVEAGLAAAAAAFEAGLSGQAAPSGAPAPVVAPTAPTPQEAAPPAPPAEPVSTPAAPAAEPAPVAAVAPTTPPAPSLSVQDPAAKRFLDMFGGDPEKALKAALEHNNRLSELAKVAPHLFKDGGPADPAQAGRLPDVPFRAPDPAVAEPPVEIPPVEVDPAQVMAAVQEQVFADATSVNLMRAFSANDQKATVLDQKVRQLEREAAYLNVKLTDPDFTSDELKTAELKDKARDIRSELIVSRQELSILNSQNSQLDADFRARRREIHQGVEQWFGERAQSEALEKAVEQARTDEFTQFQAAWSPALDRAITAHGIPADQAASFKQRAKIEAQAMLGASPSFTITNVDGFVGPIAKKFMDEMDGFHRARSAQYAAQAAQRAATPAPPTPTAAPSSAAATVTDDPDVLFERASDVFRRGVLQR